MRVRQLFLVLCLAVAAPRLGSGQAATPAQSQTTPARADRAVQSHATAVLVDVVVRDRRGQPVTDLGAGDFEIFEDGVRQEVGSVTLYTPESGGAPARVAAAEPAPAEPASPSKSAALEPPPQPVVALVFDRLSPEARAVAYKAALGYVGTAGLSQSMIGVFGIDMSLVTQQNYTRDSGKLRSAIEGLGTRSNARGESQGAA